MLPLAIKQQKNTAKSAIFAPKVREIQQKYKNNQQKQQEEMTKLQQQGYNPMGGCGTMLLTFLILFGVLDVVYKPMTHILHTSSEKVTSMIQESYDVEITEFFVTEVTRPGDELADMKEEALQKHNDIVRDAQQILDYYNANCLAQGDAAKDMSVFDSVSVEAKTVIKTVISHSMLAEYEKNEKSVLFTDTDLYKLTDEENTAMNELADEQARADYKRAHCISDAAREGNVVLDISGEKLGAVIGKRGETLDSLQYLAILASNRAEESYCRISLDCNGYRAKRRETLEALARRTSAKVIKQGRKIALEPMNPYERRIIHSCVAEIEGVSSHSTGTEPYRKVVIYADKPKFDNRRRSSGGRGDRRGSGTPARSYKQSTGFSTSFEREYKRRSYEPDENADAGEFSKETVDAERSATLYGKIEL